MTIDGLEFYGEISFLKGALQFADRITTVSPTYAKEIQSPEGGMGLDGLLRARSKVVSGIVNGIDENVWNPAEDSFLVSRYDRASVERRTLNKSHLQRRMGLREDQDALLYGVVSRLSWQKGLDLVLATLPTLLETGAQLVLLGSGDRVLQDGFARASAAYPDHIASAFTFDEELAHQIQGGCDALLVPSRFEPCGLTQLCALRYGALPIVARVGGLVDTVVDIQATRSADQATGIQFAPITEPMLAATLRTASALWLDRASWMGMQQSAMQADVGWSKPAEQYSALYKSLM
jgi:starch synthase